VGYKLRKNLNKLSAAAEKQMVQCRVPIIGSKVTPTGILSGIEGINMEVARRNSFIS